MSLFPPRTSCTLSRRCTDISTTDISTLTHVHDRSFSDSIDSRPRTHYEVGGGQPCDDTMSGVWVFSYGANLSRKVQQRRRAEPLETHAAILRGYALRFVHRGGFAAIEEEEDSQTSSSCVVYGQAQKYDAAAFERIRDAEKGYITTTVDPYVGETKMRCVAFVTPPEMRLVREVLPTQKYLATLRAGAIDACLPACRIAELEAQEACAHSTAAHEDTPRARRTFLYLGSIAVAGLLFATLQTQKHVTDAV